MRWFCGLAMGLIFAGCGDSAGLEDVELTVERTLPGLEHDVQVLRTELNVPHIYAKNATDLARVMGYVTAQDRWVHAELLRRYGSGTTAEILGDLGTEIDLQARSRGLAVVAQRVWASLGEEQRARFEAFAQGMNAYADAVKIGRFPVPEELELVAGFRGVDDPKDLMLPIDGPGVAAIAAVVVSQAGFESLDVLNEAVAEELPLHFTGGPLFAARRAGLEHDIWRAVAPVHRLTQVRPGEASSARGLRAATEVDGTRPSRLSAKKGGKSGGMLQRLATRSMAFQERIGTSVKSEFGSNAWAVGSKGTGGGTVLANDGHLPLTIPSFFFQACMDTEYLGDGGQTDCGQVIPGLPLLGVGTNGHIAWGQTYLYSDVTDWYAEELQLGAGGLPTQSRFEGQWRPLERIDEVYRIAGADDVTTETWPRFTTFDGRWLVAIEGDLLEPAEARRTSNPVVAIDGEYITPRDVDGDGVVRGMSFDWTAFEVGETIAAADRFARTKSVAEFREQTKKLSGYAQNLVVADVHGDIMYSGHTALPCRDALRGDGTTWAEGGDPTRILDGTRFGSFDVSSGCTIPFESSPRAVSPAAGFVHTANHDPLGNGFDDDLGNDEVYIGGPYALGYRADTIDRFLANAVATRSATVDAMAQLQGDHHSPLGLEYTPALSAAVAAAKAALAKAAAQRSATEARLVAVYEPAAARIDEALGRVEAWVGRGAQAKSGVETFYAAPTAQDREDAVATMIFNAWLRRYIDGVFADEDIDFVWAIQPERMILRTLHRITAGRGAGNPMGLASFTSSTSESAFFDLRETAPIETSEEIIVGALANALEALSGSTADDGFGTIDMTQWLWGMRHQVRFDSLLAQLGSDNPAVGILSIKFSLTTEHLPLAPDLEPTDPRARLEYFPRNGDFFNVDAGSPSRERRRWYTYGNGPVMRMVIALNEDGVTGRNILPGGQSGDTRSPHFADQAAKWLGNETVPIRFTPKDAVAGATGRELFRPAK